MNGQEILKLYFFVCLAGIASFFFFAGLRAISAGLKIRLPHRQMIGIAQSLIVLSVLAPVGIGLLPHESLPKLEWKRFQPAYEGSFAKERLKHLQTGEQKLTEILPQIEETVASSWNEKLRQISSRLSALLGFEWSLAALVLLLTGVSLFLIRLSLHLFRLRSLLASASTVRLFGRVRVAVSDAIEVPFSVRLGRAAWVVLPNALLGRPQDYRLAIRHEIQHHRQRDTAWAIWIEILLCLFFPNPAMHLWKREIAELQEFSCDEALLGRKGVSAHEYASCLIRVAEAALGARNLHVGTICMAKVSMNPFYKKSFLRRRVEMFVSQKQGRNHRWMAAGMGTLVAMLTIAVAFGADQIVRGKSSDSINPGKVVLDPEIQKIAENVLSDAIHRQNAKAGFALVADPRTGKILAVANIDKTGKKSGYWALSQRLEPASIMKTLVVAEAIEQGLTQPQESHSCENGSYRYGGQVYHDWKSGGWSRLTTEDMLALSSNICAMKVGEKVGAQGLRKMLTRFGFGPGGTASSFPAARPGVEPPVEDPASPKLVPYVSSGFGFHVTPIEMLQAYGAIANGGVLMAPKMANDSGAPEPIRRIISAESADKMKGLLHRVVLKGTGKGHASSDLYSTAGKTATSYMPDLTQGERVDRKKKGNFAGFIGFAPVREPRVEVYVGILDPNTNTGGAHGGEHAAPVFKHIAEEVLKHLKVAPDQPQG